jgi:amino acid adenylation domain-containing protein
MTRVLVGQRLRNDTSDTEHTIVSRFERQVAAAPDRPAIVTGEISLTYRALDLKANCIAAALASRSSQRHQPIVLFMKDEAARIAAILGALKANRIFVPLAPDSPKEWLTQVIADSGAAQILVDDSNRPVSELAAGVTIVNLDELALSAQPFSIDQIVSPDDTAYITYTSGSAGRPKGVAISHRRVVHNSDVRSAVFGLSHSDRIANLASSVGSAGLTHTFLSLLLGAGLFPFDLKHHGLQKLAPWLIAQEITYISFFGSLLRTWLASIPDDLRFPALGVVGANGERLYAEDVIRLAQHLEGDWRIGHCYSATECGTIAAQTFNSSNLPTAGVVSVGPPVDGAEVSIMDETDALVSRGETGEIVVRSRFLAQGYWNNPDLTVKVFQTDSIDNNIRIFRTGDLGRWRDDGTLEHLGRKGRTIRLRGYNIEPLQVECELVRQPGVTDAIVMLHDGGAGREPYLVGYVVAPPSTSPSAIRQELAGRLPSYMVPSHIVLLDKFPIASSGKIDHKKLPPHELEEARVTVFRPPSDDCEHQLLAIWREVLKTPKIGIDDNFFEVGGTSLQALAVFARIEARLGCNLSPTALVQAPTVACLAEFIRATTGFVATQSLVPLRASGNGLPLFLVHNLYCYVLYYRHLLSDLRNDRPVFGLQPLPLDGKHRIPRTVESMAADYISEIRRMLPHGPYFIAGHSFGGLVSFEMAQQLVSEGQCVGFLGVIDTRLHNAPTSPNAPEPGSQINATTRFSPRIYDFFNKLRWTKDAALKRWYSLWLGLGHSIPFEHRPLCYDRICMQAIRDYVPKPYPGHVTMFSSAGNSDRQRADWGSLASGGLTVLELPAGHDDMVLSPHSKLLAEHIDACLLAAVREK